MARKFTSEHIAECRRIIRDGSKSFYFASLMLPTQVRMAATALYAFCRVTDDIADEGDATLKSIDALSDRLDRAYDRRPFDHPADCAFSEVVHHFGIPKEIPAALIEGYRWDIEERSCETLSDVIAYSARVAGTVGIMMSIVMGRRINTTLARACDLGVSMQLINIARDVGEDARNGRIYLPREWMREAGIDPEEFLKHPEFSSELGSVVERLLDVADEIYERGMSGILNLPTSCHLGIRSAGMVYAEIGTKVRQNECNSVDTRAYTSKGRKLGLMLKSASAPFSALEADTSPALEEVQFLIDVAARDSDTAFGDGEWLLELFAELEKRDQAYLQTVRSGM